MDVCTICLQSATCPQSGNRHQVPSFCASPHCACNIIGCPAYVHHLHCKLQGLLTAALLLVNPRTPCATLASTLLYFAALTHPLMNASQAASRAPPSTGGVIGALVLAPTLPSALLPARSEPSALLAAVLRELASSAMPGSSCIGFVWPWRLRCFSTCKAWQSHEVPSRYFAPMSVIATRCRESCAPLLNIAQAIDCCSHLLSRFGWENLD